MGTNASEGLSQAERLIAETIASSRRMGWTESGAAVRCITFRDYMSVCLYAPQYGYYRKGIRVGKAGDFYTSSAIGEEMGVCLAAYLANAAAERFGAEGGERLELVDWGGGIGRLGRQMLDAWRSRNPEQARRVRLTVVDGHPEHRRRAEEELAEAIAGGSARVMNEAEAERFPWEAERTIVVCNELLDAMPVHRVCRVGGRLLERGVAWDERRGRFYDCLTEPSDGRLAEASLARDGMRLREGQTAEVSLDGQIWLSGLLGRLGRGLVVIVDYGDESEELVSPHRMDGTLVCYRNHLASFDPYEAPGEQDLTAHVNFTSLRRAAQDAGWRESWYGTQKRFLVEAGLLERLVAHADADPFHPAARRNRAIRQLLLSDGMSELFKVQVFASEPDPA
ncbi:SAM-dependent methyltransferase [Cohnella zeiphila]|uniref:SAM-dependent methyltransferase n=1 Tax=Cohnella zeiphila TaxID=2761120 RepID=A0A7X0SGY2_9BACL|nr:SAM-dependent methyltransferase [Cohnella zeiphila]MBB6729671.1 SAM-dependent methyltransferase [Cohnella zeiphila]